MCLTLFGLDKKSFSKHFEKMGSIKKVLQKISKKISSIKLTYNHSKQDQEKFIDELSYNLDYALGQSNTVHVQGHFNLNCLKENEKNKLETVMTPYGLQIVDVPEPTRLAQISESHIDYIFTKSIEEIR